MKYLCLVYSAEDRLGAIPVSECLACADAVQRSGQLLAAEALQPVGTARTVRVRPGGLTVTDGPFAETKEQLAGFYLVEAENLDAALRIAATIPAARVGSIEVRPIRDLGVE